MGRQVRKEWNRQQRGRAKDRLKRELREQKYLKGGESMGITELNKQLENAYKEINQIREERERYKRAWEAEKKINQAQYEEIKDLEQQVASWRREAMICRGILALYIVAGALLSMIGG